MSGFFSFSRWLGIVGKEFIQLKRDRLTFGMIVGIPVIQLVLFGFAINSDPKHLPTMLLDFDRSEFSRSIEAALEAALAPFRDEPGRTWRRIEPGLEDVFIHLMEDRENAAPKSATEVATGAEHTSP